MDELVTVTTVRQVEARPSISDPERGDWPADSIYIKGGTCVNEDQMFEADVVVEGGVIREIGTGVDVPASARVVDAKGKLVIPGGVDAATHFQLPLMNATSIDDFYSGSRAALAGGTTMIVDCVWDADSASLLDSFDKWRDWADPKVACDYSLCVGVTRWDQKVAKEMNSLVSSKGVNTFRVSQEYKDVYMLDDGELLQVFRKCKELGAFVTTLAENGHVIEKKSEELLSLGITGPEGHVMCRPEEIEAEAAYRAIVLANQERCPLAISPVTSRSAAKVIADARRKGYVVFGAPVSACLATDGTHHWNHCWRHASAYVMVPALRPDPTTPAALMEHVSSGDLQYTGSAHCTFSAEQKALGCKDFRKIPHGVNGVEERMSVVWEKGVNSGLISACQFVAVTSSTAAKIFNLYPRKGRLAVGSDADIVVWDPHLTKVISHKTQTGAGDFNIFEGMEVRGAPSVVIANGKVVMDEEGLHTKPGWGRFIPTPPHSSFVYSRVAARDHTLAPQKVERDDSGVTPTAEDVPDKPDAALVVEEVVVATQVVDHFHQRPPTSCGGRHMQQSSFTLSGEQFDDKVAQKTSSRVLNPPGGRTSQLW